MQNDVRKRFTFRLPKELHSMLIREADEKGTSVNALILSILWKFFENDGQQDRAKK